MCVEVSKRGNDGNFVSMRIIYSPVVEGAEAESGARVVEEAVDRDEDAAGGSEEA